MARFTQTEIQAFVENNLNELLKERTGKQIENFEHDSLLLDSGLDSLGFAILVSRLEDELEYDPFSEAKEAYYPQTFQDFIEFYYQNQP